MKEWLQSFADPSFMPHGHCYLWRPDILWTHVVADAVIGLAYYTIPVLLAFFLYKRKNVIAMPEIILLFVAFIFLCGTTHFFSIYTTWHPAYELQGWLKALTALISFTTALVLMPKLPQLVALPGIQRAYENSQQALSDIRAEKEEMQVVYDAAVDRESRIVQLKNEVNALLAAQGEGPKYLCEMKASM